DAARTACPGLAVSDEAFVEHLARHWGDAPIDRWPREHAGDLLLACACARGAEGAVVRFEERHGDVVDRVLARMRLGADGAHDAKQLLRARLLVGERDTPPRIAGYAGRGGL